MKKGWNFNRMGMIVKDLEAGVKHYQSIGFILVEQPVEIEWKEKRYEVYGESLSPMKVIKLKEASLYKGSLLIELCQPVKGNSLQMEFLKKHGEGINYVGFEVDDLSKENKKMLKNGYPIIQRIKDQNEIVIETYHDTRKIGNVIIALHQKPNTYSNEPIPDDDWKLEHIGFMVRDTDKAVQFYKSLGFKESFPSVVLSAKVQPSFRIKQSFLEKSSLMIELFEHIEGESLWGDYYKKHGEGINHISFAVDNLDKENTRMIENGFPTINIALKSDDRLSEVYYDTSKIGEVYMCLYQGKPRVTFEKLFRSLLEMPVLVIEASDS